MIFISAPVENNILDALFLTPGSERFPDKLCLFSFLNTRFCGYFFLPRADRQKGNSLQIVNNLNLDLLVAAENCQTGFFSCSTYFLADPHTDPCSSFQFS